MLEIPESVLDDIENELDNLARGIGAPEDMRKFADRVLETVQVLRTEITYQEQRVEDVYSEIADYQHEIDRHESTISDLNSDIEHLNDEIEDMRVEASGLEISLETTKEMLEDKELEVERLTDYIDGIKPYLDPLMKRGAAE